MSFARRLWKWSAATLAALLILLAIGVGVFRAAVPLVPELRADAEAMAERALGWPVHIGALDLRWAIVGPELVLTDVQLLAPQSRQPLVVAAQLDIVFGPLDLFQEGALRPSHVRLHQPTLALERGADDVLFLAGYALPAANGARADWRELLDLALRHGRLTILDGELHYRDTARGIDEWKLGITELSLASNGSSHELEASIAPPGALGERIVAAFSAQGPAAQPEDWRWQLEIEAHELRLQEWYRQAGWVADARVTGSVNATGMLAGRGIGEVSGSGRVDIAGLGVLDVVPVATPADGATFDAIGFDWTFGREGDAFGVGVTRLSTARAGARTGNGAFSVTAGRGEFPLEIAASSLPLGELAGLVRLLPDGGALAQWRSAVRALSPEGEIRELRLALDASAEPASFRVEGVFQDLGARPFRAMPGFSRLSGRVSGNEAGGTLVIDSRDVTLDFGDLFRTPLPAAELRAHLGWARTEGGFRITGNDIAVANPEARVSATMTLDLPADAGARIDLAAVAHDVDLGARSRWLPVGIMSDALVHWLDTAISGGRVPEATFTLKGPLANYPFRDGSGVFDIRFVTEDTGVDYAPGWPGIRDLRADVHFHGAALDIEILGAQAADGLAVRTGTARFADLRDALLETSASVSGDMQAAWRFLAASPLHEPLGGLLGSVETSGAMQANVALDIPLRNPAATTVRVEATLDAVDVHPVALPWTVEDLKGAVVVTERSVTAEHLEGSLTGAPFTASIAAGEAADEGGFAATQVSMQGRTPVTAFETVLPPAWLAELGGAFDWQGELRIPGGGEPLDLSIRSTLDGVTSTLPAPLDRVQPVDARLTLPGGRVDAAFSMQALGAGQVRYAETPDGWMFERGRLRFAASEPPALPQTPGLQLDGAVATLDASAWLALLAGAPTAGEPLLRGFDLKAGQLLARDFVLAEQSLRGTRTGAGGWDLALTGPAAGVVRIPAPGSQQPWDIVLERLHLPETGASEAGADAGADAEVPAPPPDPRALPGFRIDIGDFRAAGLHLGHVRGELQRTAIGYTTQGLQAQAPSFTLTLDGRWEVVEGDHYTSMTSVLESRDVGETLARLGYEPGIDADSGRITANLAWHAAPLSMDYALLEGNMKFDFRDGSLREVNPGAGRVLGLLSIAALPRRLLLDFSDFFGEGLHFDTLTGDFLLTQGNAYTTNVQLQGPSVSALLVGRTGLVAHDYDQLAIVAPDVSASIPVAGYIAAGPTVGAALLLLSQLLKAPLEDITQVKYRITGSWEDPLIERVQESDASKTVPPAAR